MPKQTFAQYLINKSLPPDIRVEKPVDSSELRRILIDVEKRHPDKYGVVVMDLKRLGDKFSTLEGITMGMEEITAPNKAKRDALLKKYKKLYGGAKSDAERLKYQDELQNELIKNDVDGTTDDASLMVRAGAFSGGKHVQLVKLRTSPVMVSDHKGDIVPEIFDKSYAEGQPIMQHWLQSAEARKNLATIQLSTSGPGELNKVISNLMNSSVVSGQDCGTMQGILLNSSDDDILDRYLAAKAGNYRRNALITPEIQQDLIKRGPQKVLVRSPQTCEAKDQTVCVKCMGLSISTGKHLSIGDNAGMIASGALSEPLTQLTLSAKHSVTMAGKKVGLTGESGFRTFTTMPKEYPNRKILCEIYGVVYRIKRAPQGGYYIQIRQTKKVPERYIERAQPVEGLRGYLQYYIPPQRKIPKEIKEQTEVYPGMELTDGIDNLKDIARLKNLGYARSVAAEGMRNIYKNTGQSVDRRHFELLARNMMSHVKLEKVPKDFPFMRGEIVEYNALRGAMNKVTAKSMPLSRAEGAVLVEPVHQFTAGTELTSAIIARMKDDGIERVKATYELEVSPVIAPITRALNQKGRDWLAKLNHRYIKDTLRDAAAYGQKSDIHGFNPISAYAYGVEMRQDEQGRY